MRNVPIQSRARWRTQVVVGYVYNLRYGSQQDLQRLLDDTAKQLAEKDDNPPDLQVKWATKGKYAWVLLGPKDRNHKAWQSTAALETRLENILNSASDGARARTRKKDKNGTSATGTVSFEWCRERLPDFVNSL